MTAAAPQKTDDPNSRLIVCASIDDFYLQPARALVGQLCRPFLDQMVITPLEVLYSSRNQIRLDGAGTLLRDATERAAGLQAKVTGQKTHERTRELQGLIDQLINHTRQVEQAEPPRALRPGELVRSVGEIKAQGGPQADARVYRMLTEVLAGSRMWLEKIDRILGLMEEAGRSMALPYIDALLGEAIISDTAQDAIFGRRMVLEDRIDDLLDVLKGTYPRRRIGEAPEIAKKLMGFLQTLPLEETKQAIETAVVQLLASRNPVASPEMMSELKATHALLGRLRHEDRIIGGRRALEFIDKRMARLLTQENIADYIRGAASLPERLISLLGIYSVTFGPANKKIVESFIQRYFADEDFDRRLVTGEGSGAHKLRIISNLYRAIAGAPLGTQEKNALAAKLSAMQAGYIAQTRMFATLEKQLPNSAKKAQHVMGMIEEGCFIPGENLDRARALVQHYLTRPDFFDRYFDGVPAGDGRKQLLQELKTKLDSLGIALPARA